MEAVQGGCVRSTLYHRAPPSVCLSSVVVPSTLLVRWVPWCVCVCVCVRVCVRVCVCFVMGWCRRRVAGGPQFRVVLCVVLWLSRRTSSAAGAPAHARTHHAEHHCSNHAHRFRFPCIDAVSARRRSLRRYSSSKPLIRWVWLCVRVLFRGDRGGDGGVMSAAGRE